MRGRIGLCVAIVAAAVSLGCASLPNSGESYVLRVKFESVYNRGYVMETLVRINQPFTLTRRNGRVRNTLSGLLNPPVDGGYPLELTISEWASEKSNITGTVRLDLELEKPWSGGVAESFVYGRTVTLSKK